ncbi:hypothetical protein [Kitasatospora purpeofusca]|uniref:Uncharacterized protein n=1 Tax=Kitasatospora purpeofusca TaxID=67352 RepID=A0ABZ1UA48_9ACTN|nr:hypothetical protein [Kitasatospora purpeofusca]
MDEGGEPACWLDRVCEDCGRVRERPGPGPCEHCASGADTNADTKANEDEDEADNENPRADHRR